MSATPAAAIDLHGAPPPLSEAEAADFQAAATRITDAVETFMQGKAEVVRLALTCLLAEGHLLLEDVPGVGKTSLARCLAGALGAPWQRIQFTPDLLPGDVTGVSVFHQDSSTFVFHPGPIFANVVLADEINRTSPKTQSALLEAMQEFEVTYAGTTYALERPFFILATQNPIEQAGTFPLPEAQLDRFLLYIKIGYPSADEERAVLEATTGMKHSSIQKVIDGKRILEAQALVREVHINADLVAWVNYLVRSSRPGPNADKMVGDFVRWGAGPRAGQAMILTAKAKALLAGRFSVTPDDLNSMALPVLRHRILMNFKAEAEGITADDVTRHLLQKLSSTVLKTR